MEDPAIVMSLLNTQINKISASDKTTAFVTTDGNAFIMGKDFSSRPGNQFAATAQAELDLKQGVPYKMKLPEKVADVAMGMNHMLLLSKSGAVYSAGSNQFGQLGFSSAKLNEFHEHPLTLQKSFYTIEPIKIPFFSSNPQQLKNNGPGKLESTPVKAICAGDNFSLSLTHDGKVYAWGLADDGRLGIRNIVA